MLPRFRQQVKGIRDTDNSRAPSEDLGNVRAAERVTRVNNRTEILNVQQYIRVIMQ